MRESVVSPRRGFSLIELLVAMTILAMILLIVVGLTDFTARAWRDARTRVDAFQSARNVFENVTRLLSQATLNTYYDYFDSAGRSSREPGFSGPHHYGRQSDLHFVSGKNLVPGQVTHAVFFQAPRGYAQSTNLQRLDTLLNACGFYIVHGPDAQRPAFLDSLPHAPPNEVRFRFMQFIQPRTAPVDQMTVYSDSGNTWFTAPLNAGNPPVEEIASNIIAMVLRPRRSTGDEAHSTDAPLAPNYEYDSRNKNNPSTVHQLPPLIDVVLVALDERSARRWEEEGLALPGDLFAQADKLDDDLRRLENDILAPQRLRYRIFRTTVALRSSKWSS